MIKHVWIQGLLLSMAPVTVIGSISQQAPDQCRDITVVGAHIKYFEQQPINTVSASSEETSIADLTIELLVKLSDDDQQTSHKFPTRRTQELAIYGHSSKEFAFNKEQFAKVHEPYPSGMRLDVQDAFFQEISPLVQDATKKVLQALSSLRPTHCNSQQITIVIGEESRGPTVIEVKIGIMTYIFNGSSLIFEYLRLESHDYGFELKFIDSF